MKFRKLTLDESLFDGDSASILTYDDEFVGTDLPHNMLQGPASGSDSGIADAILSAINDEFETIRVYNSLVETLKYESSNNPEYSQFIDVINDINAEENKHVGQLQELLKQISPNANFIGVGEEEGERQFNFKNGQLAVQSWETTKQTALDQGDHESDVCTLTDVDDIM